MTSKPHLVILTLAAVAGLGWWMWQGTVPKEVGPLSDGASQLADKPAPARVISVATQGPDIVIIGPEDSGAENAGAPPQLEILQARWVILLSDWDEMQGSLPGPPQRAVPLAWIAQQFHRGAPPTSPKLAAANHRATYHEFSPDTTSRI